MEKSVFYPFLFFVFLITMIGGWIPTIRVWSQSTFRMIISFCAGVLLGAVFFHIVPEITTVLGAKMGYSVMAGFLMIFVLEKFIMVHPCEEGECDYHKIGLAAYVGIGFHSILDGIAIGVGSMMNLSLVILLAVAVHKFPAALALSSLFVKGGAYNGRKSSPRCSFFPWRPRWVRSHRCSSFRASVPEVVAVALGISAGTFLFISTADLLPTVYEEHSIRGNTRTSSASVWESGS